MSPQPSFSDPTPAGDGRFSYQGLDRVIHEKARLGILSSLVTHPEGLLFNNLKQLCSLTDGNLSRHLGVLSDAGLVEIWKEVGRKRTQTMYRLTDQGRKRFMDYIEVLETVVSDAATSSQAADSARVRQTSHTKGKLSEGWSPA